MGHLLLICCLIALAKPIHAETAHRIAVIAHRGEHLQHPENTLPAFAEAARVGADFFELDVRTSADGKLILSHDASVDRCTNGHGTLSDLSFAELRLLDAGIKTGPQFAGTKMPTFDEALALAHAAGIGVYVDVKAAAAAEMVSRIAVHGMTEQVVMYCGAGVARQILALNPKLKIMPEAVSVERAEALIGEFHPKVIAFDARDFTADVIALVKKAGARIFVDRLGPADNREAWQAAIDAGADGIQTDHPAELVAFLKSKGYR